jgi:hypothetical protein
MKIMLLADVIDAILINEGLNARQLERKTGISYNCIQPYQHGRIKAMSAKNAGRILDAFPHSNYNPHWVHAGKGEMKFPQKDYISFLEKELADTRDKLSMARQLLAAKAENEILRSKK